MIYKIFATINTWDISSLVSPSALSGCKTWLFLFLSRKAKAWDQFHRLKTCIHLRKCRYLVVSVNKFTISLKESFYNRLSLLQDDSFSRAQNFLRKGTCSYRDYSCSDKVLCKCHKQLRWSVTITIWSIWRVWSQSHKRTANTTRHAHTVMFLIRAGCSLRYVCPA